MPAGGTAGRQSSIFFRRGAGTRQAELVMLKRFVMDAGGVTAIEYGLIVAVLSLAIVAGIGVATDSLEFLFANNASKLQQTLAQ